MKKTTEFCTYESEMILNSRYNWKEKSLEVEFKGGSIYRYEDVDPIDYQSFSNNEESIGKAFNQYIRKYEGKKISIGDDTNKKVQD